MEKLNLKIDRTKKITQTGKPYKKYSGRKDQFLGKDFWKKRPDKRVNKRERNLDVNIQTKIF